MNYQQLLEHTLQQTSGTVSPLVLHSCCAVCSSYVIEYLSQYFDITVFYYNPNIFPKEEYEKRKAEQKRLIATVNYKNPVHFADADYDHNEFLDCAKGFETQPEGGARCERCFKLRLDKTAAFAKNSSISLFTTTLTVSPHKNAPLINMIGEQSAKQYGVQWLPSDFKKKDGYLKSNRLAAKYGLYRQNYCGCEFALRLQKENND